MADTPTDASGFDEFYRGTSRRLLQYAYGLTGDLGDAQDVVQEVYIRAWQRWTRLVRYDSSEAWLRLVATRLATDRWRRFGARRAAASVLGVGTPAVAAPPPPAEDTIVLMAAMRSLPIDQRRAIALHYLLDLPVAEVATEIGVPEGTVKSWLARGRAALAQKLSPAPVRTANGGTDV
jgi:RNA polymerase sigma-70 factor, ECF subfamily